MSAPVMPTEMSFEMGSGTTSSSRYMQTALASMTATAFGSASSFRLSSIGPKESTRDITTVTTYRP
jgi:hypothetical protein